MANETNGDVQCPNCGRFTPLGRFCEHCGARVDVPQSPPPPAKTTKQPSSVSTILLVIGILFLLVIIAAVIIAFIFGMAANLQKYPANTSATKVPATTTVSPAGPKDASIVVSSNVAGAQIAIDGDYAGMTSIKGPTTIAVTSGSHTVSVSKEGYSPYSDTVTTAGGRTTTVYAALESDRNPAPADTPGVIFTSSGYSPSGTNYPQSPGSWHAGSTTTIQVSGGSYYYFYPKLKSGDREKISVVTDGAPIDLMIMDSSNFDSYKNSFSTKGSWLSWNRLSIIKDEYTFVAPNDGTYYFVLDNTNSPKNGANAGRNVNVAVTFSSYY